MSALTRWALTVAELAVVALVAAFFMMGATCRDPRTWIDSVDRASGSRPIGKPGSRARTSIETDSAFQLFMVSVGPRDFPGE